MDLFGLGLVLRVTLLLCQVSAYLLPTSRGSPLGALRRLFQCKFRGTIVRRMVTKGVMTMYYGRADLEVVT